MAEEILLNIATYRVSVRSPYEQLSELKMKNYQSLHHYTRVT